MRRKEKEIKDHEEIMEILKRASVCRLGLSYHDIPYVVPMNYGYQDNCLYFHSAKAGKKLDIIRKNPHVCFEIDLETQVIKREKPCHWGMKYKSVIGFGVAELIPEVAAKKEALKIILKHYTTESFEFSDQDVENVEIIKVEINEMSGKKSG